MKIDIKRARDFRQYFAYTMPQLYPKIAGLTIFYNEGLYYVYVSHSGDFVSALETISEVEAALEDPRTFYKLITDKDWPTFEKKVPKPKSSAVEVTVDDLEIEI